MSKLFSIYFEVIELDGKFRVSLTDSGQETTHMLIPEFDNSAEAERYALDMNSLLSRFGGEYVQRVLSPSNN